MAKTTKQTKKPTPPAGLTPKMRSELAWLITQMSHADVRQAHADLRAHRVTLDATVITRFRAGQAVWFMSRPGNERIEGVIVDVNDKTVRVQGPTAIWRVSPGLVMTGKGAPIPPATKPVHDAVARLRTGATKPKATPTPKPKPTAKAAWTTTKKAAGKAAAKAEAKAETRHHFADVTTTPVRPRRRSGRRPSR